MSYKKTITFFMFFAYMALPIQSCAMEWKNWKSWENSFTQDNIYKIGGGALCGLILGLGIGLFSKNKSNSTPPSNETTVTNKLETLKKEQRELLNNAKTLKNEITQKANEINNIKVEIEKLKKESEDDRNNYNKKIMLKKETIKKLKNKINGHTNEINQCKQKIQELSNQSDEKVKELNKRIEILTEKNKDLAIKLKQSDQEVTRLLNLHKNLFTKIIFKQIKDKSAQQIASDHLKDLGLENSYTVTTFRNGGNGGIWAEIVEQK